MGLANSQTDLSKLTPAHDDFRQFQDLQRAHFQELEKRLAEQDQALRSLLGSLGGFVTNLLPAGAQEVGKKLLDSIAGNKKESQEEVQKVESKLGERLEQTESTLKDHETHLASLEKNLEACCHEAEAKLERAKQALEGELACKLEALDKETALKLAALPADAVKTLEGLKKDDEAFREKLQELGKFTDAQRKELEGLSVEEILAILGAMGAATVGGGVLAKAGKSRAQPEIDRLSKEVAVLGHERRNDPRS